MPTNAGASGTNETSTPLSLDRVALKIPPFWQDEPTLWFAQVESQLSLAGITNDTTKFHYVVANLDYKVAQVVRDLIITPPANEKFETLRKELVRRLSTSQEKRIQQLLQQEEIGDRRPSEFLRHLRSLVTEPTLPEAFLRTLWVSRLPQQTQAILSTQDDTPLDKLSQLADKLHDVVATNICTVANTRDQDLKDLKEQINELRQLVLSQRRSRSKSPHPAKARSKSSNPDICWYHATFKEKATKCRSPCRFSQGN